MMTVRCISTACDLTVAGKNRKAMSRLFHSWTQVRPEQFRNPVQVTCAQLRGNTKQQALADLHALAKMSTGTATLLMIPDDNTAQGHSDDSLIRGYKITDGKVTRFTPRVFKTNKSIAKEIATADEYGKLGAANAQAVIEELRDALCLLQAKQGGRESYLMDHASSNPFKDTVLNGRQVQKEWTAGYEEMQALVEKRMEKYAKLKTKNLLAEVAILRAANEGTAAAEQHLTYADNPYDAATPSQSFAWASAYGTRSRQLAVTAEYLKTQRDKVVEYQAAVCSALGLDTSDSSKITPADVGRLVTMLSTKTATASDSDDMILDRIVPRLRLQNISLDPACAPSMPLGQHTIYVGPTYPSPALFTNNLPIALPVLTDAQIAEKNLGKYTIEGLREAASKYGPFDNYGLKSLVLCILHDEDDSMSRGGVAIKVHAIDSGVFFNAVSTALSDLVVERIVVCKGGLYSFRATES